MVYLSEVFFVAFLLSYVLIFDKLFWIKVSSQHQEFSRAAQDLITSFPLSH